MNVKLLVEVAVTPATVTEIGPAVAVAGTDAVNVVAMAVRTVAAAPVKLSVLEAGVVLKF
jgi:hypothetical protein